ncbi:hypothetical protein HJ526_02545 [Donghicola sp. C2-DW-16]|uniref:Uncharacterized protein n=1 Tax=Donghicola mangrovi TaxID=2729614 RepID=A0A850PZA2_9RHOB|nr:hypothetical protein [Donghicola mangrovi]NVO22123.1 hypothetical protein [Donghicola mangrovi]NVO26286.1 hypothetical protein [Donghicola mangrovi]
MFTIGHLLAARKIAAATAESHVAEATDRPVRKKVSRSEMERLFRTDLQAHSELAPRASA